MYYKKFTQLITLLFLVAGCKEVASPLLSFSTKSHSAVKNIKPADTSSTFDGFEEPLIFEFPELFYHSQSPEDLLYISNKIFARDINGNGLLDLIVDHEMDHNQSAELSRSTKAYFLINEGGSFRVGEAFNKRSDEYISDVRDVNGDGIPDLLTYSFWRNGFSIYYGVDPSRPSYQEAFFMPTATHGGETYAVDFDGDGILDIVSASGGSAVSSRLHFFKGKIGVDGGKNVIQLSKKMNIEMGVGSMGMYSHLYILEASRGGPPLFLLTSYNSKIVTLNSRGEFDSLEDVDQNLAAYPNIVRLPSGRLMFYRARISRGYSKTITVGEMDRSGSLKVVESFNLGGISDDTSRNVYSNSAPYRIGDIDGDGKVDLVGIHKEGRELIYFLGNDNGHFTNRTVLKEMTLEEEGPGNGFYTKVNSHSLELADLNGNGHDDIAALLPSVNEETQKLYIFFSKFSKKE